jgi:hypothetical protein
VCTCVFLLWQESFNKILVNNPSKRMGVLHLPPRRRSDLKASSLEPPRSPVFSAPPSPSVLMPDLVECHIIRSHWPSHPRTSSSTPILSAPPTPPPEWSSSTPIQCVPPTSIQSWSLTLRPDRGGVGASVTIPWGDIVDLEAASTTKLKAQSLWC